MYSVKSLRVSDDLEQTTIVFHPEVGADVTIHLPLEHLDVLAEQSFAALASAIAMRLAKQETVPRRPSQVRHTVLAAMTSTAQVQVHLDTRGKGPVVLGLRASTGANFLFAFDTQDAAGIARKILNDLETYRRSQ